MSDENKTENSLAISGNTAYDGKLEQTATLLNTDKIYLGIKNPTGATAIVTNEETGLKVRQTEIIGKSCYDKSLKVYKKGILPIDLETGSKGGWFPGSKTYGVSTTNDITVYSEPDVTSDIVGTIMKLDTSDPDFKWAEILTPLDDVLIDDTLKKRLQFWYSVRLSDNSLGYALAAYFDEIKYE